MAGGKRGPAKKQSPGSSGDKTKHRSHIHKSNVDSAARTLDFTGARANPYSSLGDNDEQEEAYINKVTLTDFSGSKDPFFRVSTRATRNKARKTMGEAIHVFFENNSAKTVDDFLCDVKNAGHQASSEGFGFKQAAKYIQGAIKHISELGSWTGSLWLAKDSFWKTSLDQLATARRSGDNRPPKIYINITKCSIEDYVAGMSTGPRDGPPLPHTMRHNELTEHLQRVHPESLVIVLDFPARQIGCVGENEWICEEEMDDFEVFLLNLVSAVLVAGFFAHGIGIEAIAVSTAAVKMSRLRNTLMFSMRVPVLSGRATRTEIEALTDDLPKLTIRRGIHYHFLNVPHALFRHCAMLVLLWAMGADEKVIEDGLNPTSARRIRKLCHRMHNKALNAAQRKRRQGHSSATRVRNIVLRDQTENQVNAIPPTAADNDDIEADDADVDDEFEYDGASDSEGEWESDDGSVSEFESDLDDESGEWF